uniref:Putative secreted protein n=1 Tax=Anopheles darlingi TaxID=43151 RepID=A0A2M4DCD2_ANODA
MLSRSTALSSVLSSSMSCATFDSSLRFTVRTATGVRKTEGLVGGIWWSSGNKPLRGFVGNCSGVRKLRDMMLGGSRWKIYQPESATKSTTSFDCTNAGYKNEDLLSFNEDFPQYGY